MMKGTNQQFEEIAYIFEHANGSLHSDYERKIIKESKLAKFKPLELEQIIVDGLNSNIYNNESERASGYWALSKSINSNLISHFRKWLKIELDNKNSIPIFQILVALDRFDEPAFHKNRNSRGVDETKLNIRDAKEYLNN